MASVVRTESYQRGTFGTLIKWAFIAFNVIMLIWMVGGLHAASTIEVHSSAERAGRAIGSALGFASILTFWMFGDIILGILVLVSRGKKVIVEELGGGRATSFSIASGNSEGNFSKADELIAQFKDQKNSPTANERPSYSSPVSANSFGKRR